MPDTFSPDTVRRLHASIVAEEAAAAFIAERLVALRARADDARKGGAFYITIYPDGCGSVALGGRHFGGLYAPLSDALAEAEAWIAQDDVALCNLTLGLLPDGRLPPRLSVVEG